MNTREAPFDDPKVREAVNYGIDKPALARLFSGLLAPGCSFLPPGMPGYDQAFDTTECPYGDPTQPPDLAKAQQLIKEAGADGTKVTVWGNNDDPTDKVTQAYADMLNKMGSTRRRRSSTAGSTSRRSEIRARMRRLDSRTGSRTSRIRSTSISWSTGTRSSRPTTRTTATSTTSTSTTRSIAWAGARPRVGGLGLGRSRSVPGGPPHAYVAPYGHRKLSTFLSERMDFGAAIFSPVYNNDYSSWSITGQ